jgi:lipopolysaccharide export system protein LptA
MTADSVDAYLQPRKAPASSAGQQTATRVLEGGNQLDRIVADGHIVIVQPKRRAEGNHLVYTAAEDKYVMTGGPPSIFDAERGKITGDSLTFFRRDDRVLVEGEAKSPTVTETRVAR